jgi:hypothetical protein
MAAAAAATTTTNKQQKQHVNFISIKRFLKIFSHLHMYLLNKRQNRRSKHKENFYFLDFYKTFTVFLSCNEYN